MVVVASACLRFQVIGYVLLMVGIFTSYTLKSQKRMAEVLCLEHYFRFSPRQSI